MHIILIIEFVYQYYNTYNILIGRRAWIQGRAMTYVG